MGEDLINYIRESEKKSPSIAYLKLCEDSREIRERASRNGFVWDWNSFFKKCKVFDCGMTLIAIGDIYDLNCGIAKCEETYRKVICGNHNIKLIIESEIECRARNQAVPLLDISNIKARIEPGAIIREKAEIGDNAIIMMGAVINIGAKVGRETMIDMGAVLGGRAEVGACCHIGAGAVVAGVIEPESAVPTVVEDNVFVGANAVILEGVRVGAGSIVGAGAVVTGAVPPGSLAVGVPARISPIKDAGLLAKTGIIPALREI